MDHKRAEEVAANRLQIISPMLDRTLDKAKKQDLKEAASIQYGVSERTIRRWINSYTENGFDGLKPKAPETSGTSKIPEDLIEEAIRLRREVPRRSVVEIIRILEWEGLAEPGFLRKSTLQDQLAARGYSSRQMRTYAKDVTSARRFQKPWRNYLWQSDIKYGIYINGKPTYMVCFLDDCTRNIMHSEFYESLDQSIVQDCLRKALLKHGAPDCVYFDNGKQFRSHWMKRACAKLGIRLLYAKPYNPEGKGKQERYNQTVDAFLREASLVKPRTLEQLNSLYEVWMQECYLNVPHSALGGKTPHECYQSDPHELRLVDPDTIANAFLSCEKRKVDKGGCISFSGQKYEVELGLSMIYRNVDVVYDPADISVLTVECEGFPACSAKPLVISSHSAKRPSLPERFEKTEPSSSRLLDAAQKKNREREQVRKTAISFSGMTGGGGNV